MWYFYAVAIPVTLGMVIYTLQRFASPKVLYHVKIVVTYAWFVNLSIVILVPIDVWTTICDESQNPDLQCANPSYTNFLWSSAYWSAFCLTWFLIPTMQGYEDAAEFTVTQRVKASLRKNLIHNSIVVTIGLVGVIMLLATKEFHWEKLKGLAIGASNAFALVTGALLLGFGLIELPRGLWKHADPVERAKWLSHKVSKVAEKLDDAHQELSTVLVITQATSKLIKRDPLRPDPLRPMMDMIDEMASEDASFKPSGGRLGESDMEYDTDESSMAALRHRLRRAQNFYSRYKTEYSTIVWQALEVEDTIKNLESGRRRFVSRLRMERRGLFGSLMDTLEWHWRCVIHPRVLRFLSVLFSCLSAAIVFAEATLLFHSYFDLSLFSILVKAAGLQEELVKAYVSIPLVYICVCTYFSVFKLGMFSFYYLLPGHTDSFSLLMNCSMVSRYAAPMCYNFLSLIHLTHRNKATGETEGLRTTFERRMSVLPSQYERIYPLVMVCWCLLIWGNVHNRALDLCSGWPFSALWSLRRLRFESDEAEEEEGAGGFSTSGLIILRRERASLDRGMAIGENVVPLARHFAGLEDVEVQSSPKKDMEKGLERAPDVTTPLNDSSQFSKASARDAMASLYKTLKEASPGLPMMSNVDSLDEKLAGLRENHRAMAAKYANVRGGKAKEASWKMHHGKASSEDLISLRNEPFSTRASAEWQGDVGRSSKAPFRPSPPRTPLDFDGSSEREGLHKDGLLDGVVSKLKGLTTNLVGSSWSSQKEEGERGEAVDTFESQSEDDSDRHSLLGSRRPSSSTR